MQREAGKVRQLRKACEEDERKAEELRRTLQTRQPRRPTLTSMTAAFKTAPLALKEKGEEEEEVVEQTERKSASSQNDRRQRRQDTKAEEEEHSQRMRDELSEEELPSKPYDDLAAFDQRKKRRDPEDELGSNFDQRKKRKDPDDELGANFDQQKKRRDPDDELGANLDQQKKRRDQDDELRSATDQQKKRNDADDELRSATDQQKKRRDADAELGSGAYQPTFLTALRCESASATMDRRRDSGRFRVPPEEVEELEAATGRKQRFRLLQEAQEDEERRKEALLIRIRALDAELNGPDAYELPPVSPPSKPAPERERQLLAELFGEAAAEPRAKPKPQGGRQERTALPWEVAVDLDAEFL